MILVDILTDGIFAAVAAIGFGAISDPPLRAFPSIALLAAIGHALRFCLMTYLGVDIATASLFASFSIGMGSLVLGKRIYCPMTVLYIPALLPMIPGMYAYKIVFSLIMFMQNMKVPELQEKYLIDLFTNTIVTCSVILIITIAGILLTVLLYQKPTLLIKRLMKGYMVFLNSWISIVYYMIYCGDRNYNYILAIFWGIIALIWLWDLITNYTPFERYHKYDKLTYILYAMPFLYPLLSWARGMEFPMMTTCVMPCSVAVFTIGLLLAFSRKVNLLVILFLCHWALIAFSKVYIYKIPEDLLLASATVPAIYLFFKNYFDQNLHKETKPSAKYTNWILIALCVAIGVFLSITILNELVG